MKDVAALAQPRRPCWATLGPVPRSRCKCDRFKLLQRAAVDAGRGDARAVVARRCSAMRSRMSPGNVMAWSGMEKPLSLERVRTECLTVKIGVES
eukprot:3962245-Heterocapsa_arctica.AAC.1